MVKVAFWIFIFVEYSDYARGSADELFQRIGRSGKWYIGPRTQNRRRLQKGDKVIFYQAGQAARKFVGNAVLSTGLQTPEERELFGFVLLTEVCVWNKPVALSDIATQLSFVKNRKSASAFFQGGIRRMTEADYQTIMRETM